MTIRFGSTRYHFLAIAAFAITGCSADDATAPNGRQPRPNAPVADIGNLTDAPILYGQTSASNELQSFVADQVPNYLADDFVVPEGQVWTITAVSLTGQLSVASLPLSIRPHVNGLPGSPLANADHAIAPTASDPNECDCTWWFTGATITDYLFTWPAPITLTAGRYWLAVQTGAPGGVQFFRWQRRLPDVGEYQAAYGLVNQPRWRTGTTTNNSFVVFGTSTQTISFPAITPNPVPIGTTATLAATASSDLAVTYSSLTLDVCTVDGSVVSYTAAGTCTVAADQTGNATYDPAPQSTQSVTVAKNIQTIGFTSTPPVPGYVNGTYTVGATGGGSGKPVAITVGPTDVCTANANVVRFVGVGTCTVTANQDGNAAYDAAAPVSQSVKVDYRFEGFLDPVKNGTVLNTAKAGQLIPLKWRLTDANGAPITTLAMPRITVDDLKCTLGSTTGQLAEQAAGASGLQNLGNGYYQYNWSSPASYAKSCKTLQLDLGEGSGARIARFAFTK